MKNIRLYYPDSIAENSTNLLSKEHINYIVNVMRLKRGSKVNIFNKEGEWESEIIFLEKDRVEVKFLKKIKETSETYNIELGVCLVKKNQMEMILQKASELGVKKIIPIISERTEVKDLNFERANKIAIESTEQSNQLKPPEISEIVKLKDFIVYKKKDSSIFFADVNSKYKITSSDIKKRKSISLLIGPEGDFSPTERELILANPHTISFSLSKNILRTETAVISAISLINYINSDH